jgi:hypothetical protein
MEKKLNFVKLAGKWFVHLPDYPGHYSELEMVLGADVMCDIIDKFDTGHITVTVSDKAFNTMFSTRDYILEFVNSTISNGEQDGANYRMREFKLDVWLCNITKYLFGEFLATFYIRV